MAFDEIVLHHPRPGDARLTLNAQDRHLAAGRAKDPALAPRAARSMRTTAGPPAMPWPAAVDLERALLTSSRRRRALAGATS